ncbi:hypothetical protein [Caminibacter mediatlanticus]|uniref:Uncharacterized protein n=1 Tax=Caminibacter mediatlanticus TB-2 TaxID=391592 RepID=A0AAI9AG05_9BACT|nr:hypothetical protein [Caminibacter mediatlanticus]EDM22936.1 hypothetical protein CMTB2_05507 [Caminibacter mediatlanticus TB-2]
MLDIFYNVFNFFGIDLFQPKVIWFLFNQIIYLLIGLLIIKEIFALLEKIFFIKNNRILLLTFDYLHKMFFSIFVLFTIFLIFLFNTFKIEKKKIFIKTDYELSKAEKILKRNFQDIKKYIQYQDKYYYYLRLAKKEAVKNNIKNTNYYKEKAIEYKRRAEEINKKYSS